MITDIELTLIREALDFAQKSGAQKASATLSVSSEDLVATLNGEIDRITRCQDRSLSLCLFVDGRFGSFSTNKLEEKALHDFILKAIGTVRMLAEDPCRDLADPSRTCRTALKGDELDAVDPCRNGITPETRRQAALDASVFKTPTPPEYQIVSEEGEYSDSIYEVVLMDTNGLFCRQTETSFDYGVEITIEADGEKYSGYAWDSWSRFSDLDSAACGRQALGKAVAQIGSSPAGSVKYTMVLDSECASRAISPVLRALSGYQIQQSNSFLMDSIGKNIFPKGLTVLDDPHIKGNVCSKLFDSEGAATTPHAIIEGGVVKEYFINTFIGNKLGMAPTVEDPVRPHVLPYPYEGLDRDAILKMCGDGILVTDFNGGNSNPATGDFSYGIEGFLFKDGKIVRPVSEMLVTGNFLTLWQGFKAAGSDARQCMSKLVPTLAFENVDFSG